MFRVCLDHLVLTAASLKAGTDYVQQLLGVPLEPGGSHLRMGTHNALLRLGNARYLEVIAIDPRAPAPPCPRWFGLDQPEALAMPHLAGWVARVGDIQVASHAVHHAFGDIEAMRRGELEWQITIPADGHLPFEGLAPMLIQWAASPHPAERLPDRGCALVGLEAYHPQAAHINSLLQPLGCQDSYVVSPLAFPRLVAHIQTPGGMRRLSTLGDSHG